MNKEFFSAKGLRVKLNPNGECWDFHGSNTNRGYSFVRVRNVQVSAHHLSYALFYGGAAHVTRGGNVIDHICNNPKCVNPTHLRIVSTKENVLRGTGVTARNSRKTECPLGHKYGDKRDYRGSRICLVCRRLSNKAYRLSRVDEILNKEKT